MPPSGDRGTGQLDLERGSAAKLVTDAPRARARTAILVLGMHRSGTSAMAGLFAMLGADAPRTLIGANRSNEKGHWESQAIARLNDRILESAGTTWDDWSEFNPRWISSPRADQFRQEAHRLIEAEFGRSGFFVLKDPRICRFPVFWIDILSSAGIRPVVVLPVRNPMEVAASLGERNKLDPGYGELMWLRHVLDAEAGTRSLPRLFVRYDDLLTRWSEIAQKAEPILELTWPRMSERAAIEIEDFLSSRLRHHSEDRERVVENAALSRWLRTTFDIAWRWAEAGEDRAERATLDEVRREFDEAAPAFARFIRVSRTRGTELSGLRDETARRAEEIAGLQAELEAARAEAESLRRDLDDREKALSEMQDRVGLELKDVQMSLQSLEGTVEDVGERSGSFTEAAVQLAQTRAAFERWRTVEQRENEKLVRGYREHVQFLMHEARRRDSAEAKLHRQLAAAEARIKELEGQSARLEDQLRAASRELGRAVSSLGAVGKRFLLSSLQMRRMKDRVRRAGIFDARWYVDRYKDVAKAKVDPLEHYVAYGAAEGRAPSSAFAPPHSSGSSPTAPKAVDAGRKSD